ncbi:MAG: CpaD family pilus assembly lipoprotein [Alphaproteobacteria bacterium]
MSATALTGCVSHWDMQGHNPKEYYAKNPIENKVETRFITQKVDFTSSETIAEDRKAIHAQLAQISVSAIDSVEIQVHPNQLRNLSRNEQLRKMLTKAGIKKTMITYVAAEDVSPSEANILIAHAAVVSPRCPDWRSASVTSYSNARYTGNISCATRTNLGLMVADPHDLVEGSGNERPDTNSATKAIQNYRSSQSSSAESTDGAESAGASTTGQ